MTIRRRLLISFFTLLFAIYSSCFNFFLLALAAPQKIQKIDVKTDLKSTTLFSDPLDYVKGYRKKVDQQNFKAYFKEKKSETDYLSYRYGDNWLNLSPTFSKQFTVNYETNEEQIKEKIVIDQNSSSVILSAASAESKNLSFTSTFTKNSGLKLKVDGSVWDETTAIATTKRIEFVGKDNKTLFYWEPLVYYDSSPEAQSVIGKTQLNKSKDSKNFLVTLYVPTSWLSDTSRVYPLIIDPTFTDANAKTLDTQTNWWNSAWTLNKQLTVINNGTTGLGSGTVVTQTIDTKALYDAGNIQNDCADLRITYGTTTQTELTRALAYPNGQTCSTSTATQVSFPLQSAISAGSSDANYYLYYKNAGASSPSATQQAYNIGSTQATLVLPFNGSTTAVGTGVTPTTATGAIRYSTNSAMSFDGVNDYVSLGDPINGSLDFGTGNFTVGAWVKTSSRTGNPFILSKDGYEIRISASNGAAYCYLRSGAQNVYVQGNTVLDNNVWHQIILVVERSRNVAYFVEDGVKAPERNISAVSGSLNDTANFTVSSASVYFKGLIDEVAVWNNSLSSAEIASLYNSGAGRVVQRDANTKLILHFDENGSDPRSANTAFDDSGNGNNGTIYGNAKYVSGLVGVDSSTSLGMTQGSFASHNGVFIEEGTVNRIKNPSFETNVTDSWVAKPNINFTTSQVDADGNALVGSNNIKDVFFYDTTRDSDGGAWRYNSTAQASSWYNEAFSTTRGKKKEFPEKTYIVATNTSVDIIDASENKLWMRFNASSNANDMARSGGVGSLTALNGIIYVGQTGTYIRLGEFNFVTDGGRRYWPTNGGTYVGNISQRNSGSGWNNNIAYGIINDSVNDVSVAVISGKTYVAVATDGGVSVINETDGTVANYSAVTTMNTCALLSNGDLYTNGYGTGTLTVFLKAQNDSGTLVRDYYLNATTVPATHNSGGSAPRLYATQGTSTIDGTSNTIYFGENSGLDIIQENQANYTKGSVKYFDKNHITEEMIGAIKGQWGLWETTSTDANQFKASGYLDTGKLGQAVSMYGNAAGTAGSTLTFNRGAQISGNNYEHYNINQGSISFWIKPSWNGNDNLDHEILEGGNIHIKKASWNSLTIYPFNDTNNASISTTSWTTGTWYHVVGVWNRNSTVDGTNYIQVYVNNTAGIGASSITSAGSITSTLYVGSSPTGTKQFNGLIDDFAIFDRVLSTSEITSLYNSGTGNEAGYVADSSLKFYAKLDGSGTLQPVTYNGGASASKMTAKSTELTGGTNLVTDGNMEAGNTTNWPGWGGSPSATSSKATTGVFADTQSLKVYSNGDVDGNNMVLQTITVLANTNYTFSVWYNGTNSNDTAIIQMVDGAWSAKYCYGNGYVNYYRDNSASGWKKFECSFKTNSSTAINLLLWNPKGSGTYTLFDNATLTPSLVDNGGMEGTKQGVDPYYPSGAWRLYGSPTAGEVDVVTSDKHTGSQGIYISTSSPNRGVAQTVNGVNGQWYLVSFWAKAVAGGGKIIFGDSWNNHLGNTSLGFTSSTWTKYSKVVLFNSSGTDPSLYLATTLSSTNTLYFDDISVTPLDNVATSFKSWASVSDSSALGNSLSVQGSATGVQSLAAGVRNSAYTFDGSTGYLRQATIATNIGTLGYSGNTLADDGQTFTSYKTSSGNAAYMIVVTNSDNTTSWGYIGNNSEAATSVTVYTTLARATQGWNGTSPSGKTPVGYEIRKTDFQITGNLTVGAWVKKTTGGDLAILSKNGTSNSGAYRLVTYLGGKIAFGKWGALKYGTTVVGDGNWHFVVVTYDGSNSFSGINLYADGILETSTTNLGTFTGISDSYEPLIIGADFYSSGSQNEAKTIDEPFVTAEALTATQILDMYNKGLGALNHATKSDQKLQGSTNTVQAVAASSDGSTIYAGTDTALTVFKNGKSGNYTDSDSAITSFTTATTPALVSNNSVALDLVGNATSTTPSLIVGSSANGVSGINLVRGVPTLDSSVYRFGSKAMLLDNTNSVLDTPLVMQDTQTSAPYTLSFYAYSTGVTLSNADIIPIGLNAPITTATYEDAGGGWTRVSATYNSDTGTSRSYGLQVKAGKKIYVDGVQLEQKSYSTSYADGSMGTGYSWTTANNSITTRAATTLNYASNNIDFNKGSISAWLYVPSLTRFTSTPAQTATWFRSTTFTGGRNDLYFSLYSNGGTPTWWSGNYVNGTRMYESSVGATATTGWHHVVTSWIGSNLKFYLDNQQIFNTNSYSAPQNNTAISLYDSTASTQNWNSLISDFKIYDSAISTSDVANLYNAGLSGHTEGNVLAVWQPTKTFESATIDANYIANWNTLNWTQTVPAGVGSSGILFKFAVKSADSAWSDSDFLGSDCTTGSYWSDTSSPYSIDLSSCSALAPSNSTAKRYARYRTYLSTADQTVAPTVNSLNVVYTPADQVAPATTLDSVTTPTATNSPTITGSTTDAMSNVASVDYQLDGTSGSWQACTGTMGSSTITFSCTPTGLTDGSHTIYIRATDSVGNVATSFTSASFLVDTTTPTAPGTPTVSTATTNRRPALTWAAATDAGAGLSSTPYTLEWSTDSTFSRIDGTINLSAASYTFATDLSLATWNFRVRAKDTLNHDGAWAVSSLTLTTPAAGLGAQGGGVSFDFTPNSISTNSYLLDLYANSTNYLRLYWTGAHELSLAVNDGSGESVGSVDTTSIIAVGNSYPATISYLVNQIVLKINATDQLVINKTINFAAPPTTLYFAAKNDGTLSSDTTFSNIRFSPVGSVDINSGSVATSSAQVILAATSPDTNVQIMAGNSADFSGSVWENLTTAKDWLLDNVADGLKTIYVKFVDLTGLTSLFTSTIYYDTTAPTIPGTPNTASPTNTKKPLWTWSAATDTGSGLAASAYQIQLATDTNFTQELATTTSIGTSFTSGSNLHDGVWYLRVRAVDKADNHSSYSSLGSVNIQTGAPTGSIAINQGNATANSAVDLTLTATDPNSYPIQMRLGNTTDFTGGVGFISFAANYANWTLAATGRTTIYVQFMNNLGSQSPIYSASIIYDTAAPTVPGQPQITVAYNSNKPTITWSAATDTDSGLAMTPYTLQWSTSANFSTNVNSATTTANSYTFTTGLLDTVWYFRVNAADAVGHTSAFSPTGSISFITDSIAPVGSFTINTGAVSTNNRTVTLNLTATDNYSGVSQIIIGEGSDFSHATWQNFASTKTFVLSSGDGSKTIAVKFKDGAGNSSDPITASIILDTVGPNNPSILAPLSDSFTNDHYPTFAWAQTTDSLSGVDHYRLVINNGDHDISIDTIAAATASITTNTYSLSRSNGNFYLTLKHSADWSSTDNDGQITAGQRSFSLTAFDQAGNSSSSSRNFYADFSGPTLTSLNFAAALPAQNYAVTSDLKPTLSGHATDDLALAKVEVAYYFQTILAGVEASRSLVLTETQDLGSSGTSTDFSFKPSQLLALGQYVVAITGIDQAGNRGQSQSLNLWLLTPVQAELVLAKSKVVAKNATASSTLQTPLVISLPELEKQAVLKRQKEADELTKFSQSISDNLDFVSQTIALAATNFVFKPITIISSSLWQTLVAANHTLTLALNTSANRTKEGIAAVNRQTGQQLLATAIGFQTAYHQFQNTLTRSLILATTILPGQVHQTTDLIIVKPLASLNAQLTTSAARFGEHMTAVQHSTNQNINQTITNFTATIKNSADNSVKLIASIGRSFNTVGRQSQQTITQSHRQLNSTLSARLAQAREGAGYALHSLLDPAVKTGNFIARIATGAKIAVITFESFVFDQEPTRISHVALSNVKTNSVTVTWETNHYTRNNKVNYGTSLTYDHEAWGDNATKKHSVTINGLEPGKKYFFEVMSQNKNYAYDAFYTFQTPL